MICRPGIPLKQSRHLGSFNQVREDDGHSKDSMRGFPGYYIPRGR